MTHTILIIVGSHSIILIFQNCNRNIEMKNIIAIHLTCTRCVVMESLTIQANIQHLLDLYTV